MNYSKRGLVHKLRKFIKCLRRSACGLLRVLLSSQQHTEQMCASQWWHLMYVEDLSLLCGPDRFFHSTGKAQAEWRRNTSQPRCWHWLRSYWTSGILQVILKPRSLIEHLRVMELAGVSLSPRHSCEKPRLVLTRGRRGMGGVFTVLLKTCSWELKGRGGWHLGGMRNLWDWKASLWQCPLQNPAFLSVA